MALVASQQANPILAPDEPDPLEAVNLDGRSAFVLICEHAGRRVPRSMGDMGLPAHEFDRHIAWDIGARAVSLALSAKLDAPLFMQRYSRLVCDCNRRPNVLAYAGDQRGDDDTGECRPFGPGPEGESRRDLPSISQCGHRVS